MERSPRGTVLAVDDHLPLLELLALLLPRRLGVEVVTATGVDEATSLVEAAAVRPQVAVVDDQMPGRDGFDLVAVLRERWPDIAIVMFSGTRADDVHARLASAGVSVDAVVDKMYVEHLPLVIDRILTARSYGEQEAAE